MSDTILQRSWQVRDSGSSGLLEACCVVADDVTAPMAIGAAVAATTHDWGIARAASRARHAAVVQAAWLLVNEHPRGDVGVYLRLEVARRGLTVLISDAGTLLPDLEPGSRWRSLLTGCGCADACLPISGGRELSCVMKVRPDWAIRLTWRAETLSHLGHPPYSYDWCDTREQALVRVRTYLHGVGTGAEFTALLAVHIQGPEQSEAGDWEPVGEPEPRETGSA